MSRQLQVVVALAFMVIAGMSWRATGAFASTSSCGTPGGSFIGSSDPGDVGVFGSCGVTVTDLPGGSGGSKILVIDCGYATAKDDHTHWNKACGATGFPCPAVPGTANPHQFETVFSLNDTAVPIAAWCAGGDTPMPSAKALRDEVIRLLHPPAIGISPDTGTTLVHFNTLFWIPTPTTVNLGRARLVGFPVQLRVTYERTDFDFGDGSQGSLDTPGTPYDATQDCGQCTDRFGHIFTTAGPVRITAHTYWHAQFQVRGTAWTDIPGDVTATRPGVADLTVRQSRATLVAPR